ncbi:hypothetical protein F5884DRAFT_65424 [Xylogone sp. PMI_703]|nr:hypothetical protein F5884DRAFT_65424 [Xylogone sp. PMI_703]
MTSRRGIGDASLTPEISLSTAEDDKTSNYRHATVYDAVAGRISLGGFIQKYKTVSSTRDTASSSASALPPEAILFRSKKAPTRYAEYDIYFANERIPNLNLPDSDLLKALHCYASDFYANATPDHGASDWRSLDETALIALGILMEETCKEVLGESGDLVFTEGQEIEDHPRKDLPSKETSSQQDVSSDRTPSHPNKKARKRRRLLTDD